MNPWPQTATGERKLPEWRVQGTLDTHSPDQPVAFLLRNLMVRVRKEALRVHPDGVLTQRRLVAYPGHGVRRYVYAEYYHFTPRPCECDTCTGAAPDLAGPHSEWRYGWR